MVIRGRPCSWGSSPLLHNDWDKSMGNNQGILLGLGHWENHTILSLGGNTDPSTTNTETERCDDANLAMWWHHRLSLWQVPTVKTFSWHYHDNSLISVKNQWFANLHLNIVLWLFCTRLDVSKIFGCPTFKIFHPSMQISCGLQDNFAKIHLLLLAVWLAAGQCTVGICWTPQEYVCCILWFIWLCHISKLNQHHHIGARTSAAIGIWNLIKIWSVLV